VPSDTSRPSGYRLEDPDRTGGTAATPPDPPWITVIGTTLRLWLRRRVLRVPDSGRIGTRRRGILTAAVAAVVVIGGGAAAFALTTNSPATGSHSRGASARPKLTPAQLAARAAAAAAAQADATTAARWIAAQVGQGLVLGCDPATCAAILAAGYPTGGQVVLQPGVPLPGPDALIVSTPAVRAQYGAQLTTLAPAVIAAFGTGAQGVQVRVVVPGGAQDYAQTAASALAARREAGRALLRDRNVHAHGSLRTAVGSGFVDPRLITVLRRLATRYPVGLVHLGDGGPGANGMPFRMAEVTVPSARGGHRAGSQLGGMEKLLKRQPASERPELTAKRLPNGSRVLEIKFLAPSPF
jgi:hypothetical protein